jgi:hypothetical protein
MKIQLITLLGLVAIGAIAARRLQQRVRRSVGNKVSPMPAPTPTRSASPVRVGSRQVNAHEYPGDDIGTKINNAAKSLGSGGGQIILLSSGLFKVPATIPSGCVLLLKGGIFRSVTPGPLILLSDNSALVGDNWDAVLEESVGPMNANAVSPENGRPLHTIVQDLAGATLNGNISRGLRVEHIHFRGARKDFHSAFQTVSLGNCHSVKVVRNFFDFTRAIGLQVGGAGQSGNYAQDCELDDNKFVGVATQNVAVTNAVNVSVRRNVFEKAGAPGAPGATCIDIEPNIGDRIENVIIQGNVIDVRQSPADASGNKVLNAISLNNVNGAHPWRNIQVLENQILSNVRSGGGIGYAGILIRSSVGAVVSRNKLLRCVRGIMIDTASTANHIEENTLESCGSGGTAAIEIQDVSKGNIVRGNRLIALPGDGVEETAGKISAVGGNIIQNNPGGFQK